MVQLCGDAHLMNFGFYASPERTLVFGVNDFDETLPGPYEWDLKRLLGSVRLAADSLGIAADDARSIVRQSARRYRQTNRDFIQLGYLDLWYYRVDVAAYREGVKHRPLRESLDAIAEQAQHNDNRRAARKLCQRDAEGVLRFRHDPPLLWSLESLAGQGADPSQLRRFVQHSIERYSASLRPEMQWLVGRYKVLDFALKTVGVGSVGTRCAIVLLQGRDDDDLLILQGKEAGASVLEAHLGASTAGSPGERVVRGQRLIQTVSDSFLGWVEASPGGVASYWRQFRDWKAMVQLENLDQEALADYGALCAAVLAKAHARSGDGEAIAAHLEAQGDADDALADAASASADQTRADHQRLVAAIADGELEAQPLG
ncbi:MULTISPECIES: DUF2252 domain-containing protein [unclassified Cyanobium]|uniref:DUF2252 domain-containing protein n=1 Tax=unclassified Cyanobium TaxID=2627006 RepID=UPI0020CD4080|nr:MULTISPECIES: DUF2252 family protein [unclassified Cyanobium]MCP9860213.1 DUF2252 domain-containing protein [Cyanobium sp. Cruz-8H5]MCP9867542.1 DUF2252 domain-containing protein [Cyanobium sp. Cruz-8D1]